MLTGERRIRFLVLGTHLSRRQAGAAHATIDIVNALARAPWAAVTVFAYSADAAVLESSVPLIKAERPPDPPFLWRLPPLYVVGQNARALAAADLPACDVCYTQNTALGLAFRRLHPDVLIVSHTGHVIASREFLEEGQHSTLQHRLCARLYDGLERRAFAARRWQHVVSTRLVAEQREKYYGLPSGSFRVQPLGVDVRRFDRHAQYEDVRRSLEIPSDAFVLVSVARLVPWKNVDLVIRTVAESPHLLHLIVVGDGPASGDLRRLAETSGVATRVHFVGHTHPAPYLAGSDLFVLPSAIESFGMVYAEAMHMGLPCIGLRNSPPRVLSAAEDVIPLGTGYCVASFDELRDRVDALAASRSCATAMGEQAFRLATTEYSVGRYCEFLHDVVQQNASDPK